MEEMVKKIENAYRKGIENLQYKDAIAYMEKQAKKVKTEATKEETSVKSSI